LGGGIRSVAFGGHLAEAYLEAGVGIEQIGKPYMILCKTFFSGVEVHYQTTKASMVAVSAFQCISPFKNERRLWPVARTVSMVCAVTNFF